MMEAVFSLDEAHTGKIGIQAYEANSTAPKPLQSCREAYIHSPSTADAGSAGYSPACANLWLPVVHNHLAGRHTVGIYPLLPDDSCWVLATDFDEESWREDAAAFLQTCRIHSIPAAMEISRSGKGAHVWIFFRPAGARQVKNRRTFFGLKHFAEKYALYNTWVESGVLLPPQDAENDEENGQTE